MQGIIVKNGVLSIIDLSNFLIIVKNGVLLKNMYLSLTHLNRTLDVYTRIAQNQQ